MAVPVLISFLGLMFQDNSSSDTADRVKQLVRQLQARDTAKRIDAANTLAKLGEDAEEAAPALCDATLDSSKKVASAALLALEKVRPDLYPHVATLILDEDGFNKSNAIEQLAKKGPQARPTIKILFTRFRNEILSRDKSIFRNGFDGRRTTLNAIQKIDPDHAEYIQFLRTLASKKYQGSGLRSESLELLSRWAGDDAERQKVVFSLVKDAISDERCQLVCVKLAGEYGSQAKTLLPQIKKLKLSKQESLRKAADLAVEQIESSLQSAP